MLMLGYLASQFAYLNGETASYSKRVDQAPIKWLALVLFIVCLYCGFANDRRKEPKV